ncbi:hypothetical protein CDQ84_14345 [Clostridium thermosuccinogenes]|uniref:Division initiation protein n=1 Tax=Clostridium thermosuccinogenes TaxID=84032 RepID=A0A2K2FA88_9CLOT|nr:DUF881 domain-containing protein [Pseudoclostridium thermosuccinogenes]AUS96383.1 hypothetical protein CDO33_08005 [Pseudoclostridium thermosuccinogenes]PNT95667.1 hypothetical protein CDQ85_14215 [Pseudoclostridium thermosuccinogenes]PNT96890.1 hypothetical protein CDQ84_14345 [Pseudoclostridium thermosuccinogenes]
MSKKDTRLVFFIAFVMFGLLLSVQFKSILKVNSKKLSVENKIVLYKDQLEAEKEKTKYLEEQISLAEKDRENLLNELIESQGDEYLLALKEKLDRTNLIAGLTDVKGPGIIIELDDAPGRNPDNPFEDPNDLIIHEPDILTILNELKKLGAQAISINGERLVSTSEQICAGPTILINNKRYPVPYVISVIGDPEMLYNGISESFIVYILRSYRIRVDIKKSNEVIIPKYEYLQKDIVGEGTLK